VVVEHETVSGNVFGTMPLTACIRPLAPFLTPLNPVRRTPLALPTSPFLEGPRRPCSAKGFAAAIPRIPWLVASVFSARSARLGPHANQYEYKIHVPGRLAIQRRLFIPRCRGCFD
jgi:hypothetical protein